MDQTSAQGAYLTLDHRSIRRIIVGTVLSAFIGALDTTIVATALPTIGRELSDVRNLPWVVTAYLLSATAVTPLYGKLADIFGRRPLLLTAIFVFLFGSALCALAPTMGILIAARALQGIGGGGLMSVSMTIVADIIPPRERGRYQIWFTGTFVISSLLGPLLGGLLADGIHWSAIFWINIPLGIIAFFTTNRVLKQLPGIMRRHALDLPGAVLMVLATVSLLLALSWGGVDFAWTSPQILGLLAAALALTAAFALRLRTAAEPFFPLDLLANRIVRHCVSLGFFSAGAQMALAIFLPLYFQSQFALSGPGSGVALVALMMGSVTGAFSSGQFIMRVDRYKLLAIFGTAMTLPLLVVLAWQPALPILVVEVMLFFVGLGLGTAFPLLNVAAQNSVPFWQVGTVTGANNFTRNLGGAILVPVFSAVFLGIAGVSGANPGDVVAHGTSPERLAPAFTSIFLTAAACLAISLILLLRLPMKPLRGSGEAFEPESL